MPVASNSTDNTTNTTNNNIGNGNNTDNDRANIVMETDLEISGVDFPKFSARNCQQTLSLISGGFNNTCRSISGALLYLGGIVNDGDTSSATGIDSKYKSTITCTDKNTAAFSSMRKGDIVTVSCIQVLTQVFDVKELIETQGRDEGEYFTLCLNKKPRANSLHISGVGFFKLQRGGRFIKIRKADVINEKKLYVNYQPILDMMITEINFKTKEWDVENTWSLTLEEI